MFEKIEVNGVNCHPIYNYLRSNSKLYDDKKGTAGEIPWNFAKFLVNAQGKVISYYEPRKFPDDIRSDIEKLL